MYRVWNFVTSYSVLLILGVAVGLVWANADAAGYLRLAEYPLWFNDLVGRHSGDWLAAHGAAFGFDSIGDVRRVVTFRFLVNDMLMALFFAIAAKEVWEALILDRGALRGRRAATPLIATLGGMVGPAVVYLGLAAFLFGSDTFDAVARGWAVPTATDIAFSYLIGRAVFGAGHPAVRFLLLLAIADDAGGMIILALFYPSDALVPAMLLLSLAAAVTVWGLFNLLPRWLDRDRPMAPTTTWVRLRLSLWPYAIAGCISWWAFQQSGLNPALGLLPIVPTLPHARRAFGVFAEAEQYLTDLLNRAQHILKHPVEVVLFFFGLLNAGAPLDNIGPATWLVLAGLLVGKTGGIFLFGWIAAGPLRLGLPVGMGRFDLLVVGSAAAAGLTVPLFLAGAAFDPGPVQDAARLGAVFSLGAAGLALGLGRLGRIRKRPAR